MGWKERAAQLKTDIPALWLCLRAKETPLVAKVLAAVTVGYALSPVDLIPDFVPVLGYLDDLLLLPLLVWLTLRCIPEETMERCRAETAGLWAEGKPKRWYYALPIIALWALIAGLLVKWILGLV